MYSSGFLSSANGSRWVYFLRVFDFVFGQRFLRGLLLRVVVFGKVSARFTPQGFSSVVEASCWVYFLRVLDFVFGQRFLRGLLLRVVVFGKVSARFTP